MATLMKGLRKDSAYLGLGDAYPECLKSPKPTPESGFCLSAEPTKTCTKLEAESMMWIDDIQADCKILVYSCTDPKEEIVLVVKGDVKGAEAVPARIHSECFTGDIIGSQRCDCGQQLHKFLRLLNDYPNGILMYIRGHEGRGIGLANKIKAYKLQDEGYDTVDANLKLGLPVDARNYDDALAVFRDTGVESIQLFTNNPEKIAAMKPILVGNRKLSSIENEHNKAYLNTKKERCGHQTILGSFSLPEPRKDSIQMMKIGIVYTMWNQFYVDELLKEATKKLDAQLAQHVKMVVPGASDLVSGARMMIKKHSPDAVIVLGVLIRGSSDVYEVTCNSVMTGLSQLNSSQDVPITTGLLMCSDEEQAHDRTHGDANPGKAWAETAIHMASLTL